MGGSRDVAASVVRALVAHLERALDPAAAEAVLAAAGIDPTDPRLGDDRGWFALDEVTALADAASEATGDPDVGRRGGEEHLRRDRALGLTEYLVAEGDPARALGLAVSEAGRIFPTRRVQLVESGEQHVVVELGPVDGAGGRHPFLCGVVAGHWVRIPRLFGAVGTVVHPACVARGDDRCRLVVRWDRPVAAPEDQVLLRRQRAQDLLHRFEELQAMAADLAAVNELDEAMQRIVQRAGSTMLAHRFLLVVRERSGATPDVCASGLDDAAAHDAAAALLDPEGGSGSALARHGVPVVASFGEGDGPSGQLVAFLPAGTTPRESDARLLEAYAGHAAATIGRILTTADAEREHRTAAALLHLAQSLSTAHTVAEVTALVTDAVGDVTGCEVSGVWLLDPAHTRYELQSVRDEASHPGPRTFDVMDPSGPTGLAADPSPFVLRRSGDPLVGSLLDGWEVEEAYVAPIVHRGRLYGLLSTARRSPQDHREVDTVLSTVSALANHVATAIANAELLDEIRHQATHDALTGLPNRPNIEEQAAASLRTASLLGGTVALAFVDLDRFKIVNDTLGHVIGDQLIEQVAERLEEHLRPSDAVARLGGDEFLVLLTELEGPAQAEEVAGRLLEVLRAPFDVGGESLFVTASVGVACYPDHGGDYGVLLRRADAAMYLAKGEGRNRVALHRSPVGGHRSRLKLETELHQAVERGELRVRYQPQIDLLTDEIVAVEALLRWQHPTLGLVGPGTFLSIAEESGTVVELDRWVRRTALAQTAAWAAIGAPVRMAVNVSRNDLADTGFAGSISELLDELDLSPHLVELEITDRIVMSDEDLPPSLAGLRALGVRLAVDDFGTGTSVLSRLQHCPVDVLKVDRTFIEPLSRPRPDTRLVDALVSMAHALGLEVVIEGVEDERQAHAVRLLGAELGQGFWFHRPMPAEELTPLLTLQAAMTPGGLPRTSRRRARGARR